MSENESERAGERQRWWGEREGEREILGKLIFIIIIHLVTLLLPMKSKRMQF